MFPPKPILIDKIHTSNILYHDLEYKDQCYKFCKTRDIDCLPSIHNPGKFFMLDSKNQDFAEREIESDRIIMEDTMIFSSYLLDKFEKYTVLFVYNHNELTGIIHFSDYNNVVVSTYIYTIFHEYEKLMRKLLVLNNLKNRDMIKYFEEKAAKNDFYKDRLVVYNKNQDKYSESPEFQAFYFRELIQLLRSHRIINLKVDVGGLRNMIMHAHELVRKEDESANTLIFNFTSFKEFFDLVILLLNDFRRIHNRILFFEASAF